MVYDIAYIIVRAFLLLFFRLTCIGSENVPAGGVIIACNHISLWDPPALGCVLPRKRRLHMMAKEELFAIPVFRWIITELQSFPVKRGTADRNAIRKAVGLLTSGEIVGIFPEGTRSKTGHLGPAQAGMALIALKAGVPVLPTAIIGPNKIFREGNFLPRFTIRFGAPVYPLAGKSDKENSEHINSTVMKEIAHMLLEGSAV